MPSYYFFIAKTKVGPNEMQIKSYVVLVYHYIILKYIFLNFKLNYVINKFKNKEMRLKTHSIKLVFN